MNKKIFILLIFPLLLFFPYGVFAEENLFENPIPEDHGVTGEEDPPVDSMGDIVEDQKEAETGTLIYYNELTGYQAIINDEASLLSEKEIKKLLEDMKPLTAYGHIGFLSINNNYTSTEAYADSIYHTLFGTKSGTIFLIDMDNREIYIFSDGENYQTITRSKALSITDNVYKYASRKEYYKCAKLAFEQMDTLLQGQKIMEPMRYVSIGFISMILSFFLTFLYVLSTTKIKKASNSSIVNHCDITFQMDKPTAEKVGEYKVYSPPSDSGGGGSSGGGGGGGGGSSGGGGGHSF
ncbi:MAG: TPM domain-containing protein [Bacilli bacterium]|nr:TPM domain-containing protein [Bacilli bacterium]